MPSIEALILQEKHVIVIQCYSADNRPYSAPEQIWQKNNTRRNYYIRVGSITKKASEEEIRQLNEMSVKVPFDDKTNFTASAEDLDITLIADYLGEINSPLLSQVSISKNSVLESMGLITGPPENRKIKNIALMLFCNHANKIFTGLGIDFILHKDDSGTFFEEKKFTGSIYKQLQQALSYFKNQIQKERVEKIPGQSRTRRYFNYPYEAFKESLSNAVYHMSYEQEQRIEVQFFLDKIEIISWPGAMPPITSDALREERVTGRMYRNRRLGDFLKELRLTEGRATGIPTIRKSLDDNGSEPPIFFMDEARTYFKTTLFIHEGFLEDSLTNQIYDEMPLNDLEQKILDFCLGVPRNEEEIIFNILEVSNVQKHDIKEKIISLKKTGMLNSKTIKFLYLISIAKIYYTSELGKGALKASF